MTEILIGLEKPISTHKNTVRKWFTYSVQNFDFPKPIKSNEYEIHEELALATIIHGEHAIIFQ